ncbi:MAG: enoyl-CoA hydratase/isomerase family protein [Planctomycetes bacterium]|nr:enoyl-CoA hydratase/isomerase family protein [Planctomycetota bacterium]
MSEPVAFEVEGGVATITVQREKALNALNAETLDGLERAAQRLQRDGELRGAILIGAGEKAFVAGADLKALSQVTSVGPARGLARRGQSVLRQLEQSPVPLIACVNGYALGGGLELALACHMRYASANARVGLPEVGLGLIPGYGGTQRLTRLVGRGRATELIVTGNQLKADEAAAIGLVNRVFESRDALLAGARETLAVVATRGRLAVSLALESIDRGVDADLDAALAVEADLFGVALASDDAREGIGAFLEKRAPNF